MDELTPELALSVYEFVKDGKINPKTFKPALPNLPSPQVLRSWFRSNHQFRDFIENARKLREQPKATITPTPERARQDGGYELEAADRNHDGGVVQLRARAKMTCRLDWYLKAQSITPDMHFAGHQFAKLHFDAGKVPRTIAGYKPSTGHQAWQDQLAGRSDAAAALAAAIAILHMDERDVIWSVCGLDQYAGTPQRTRLLQTGLRALAAHFATASKGVR